ncbi:MAG: hypothetical protein J5525_12260 [Lachnospiraceae bacterium]|nr:hypothetical protein [Lachnospiraceae bacterium]
MEAVLAPNESYLEMTFTKETATGRGLNNRLTMERLDSGLFQVTEGRIGITIGVHKPKVYTLPMEEWHDYYAKKITMGYTLFATEKTEAKKVVKNIASLNGIQFKPLEDKGVQNIIQRLIGFTNQLMEQQYTVKVENISDSMIERGRDILDDLALNYKDMSVAEFNNKLKVLFAVIPRRIDNLGKKLAKRNVDFQDIVANEQELFDVMVSQIKNLEIEKNNNNKTILEGYNLEWREVTPDEESWIRRKMGCEGSRYVRAWRITNKTTEDRFDAFCKKEGLTDKHGIERLFHGSRSENFWSIITTGLTINPTGVVITGKMFGNGTYFAPDACKSMGYTDRTGSRWANGSSSTGFLGIYKVAVGNPASPQSAGSYTWQGLKKGGYHSVWCKRGGKIGLRMDEVVVYQDCQDTIEYLIEVGM